MLDWSLINNAFQTCDVFILYVTFEIYFEHNNEKMRIIHCVFFFHFVIHGNLDWSKNSNTAEYKKSRKIFNLRGFNVHWMRFFWCFGIGFYFLRLNIVVQKSMLINCMSMKCHNNNGMRIFSLVKLCVLRATPLHWMMQKMNWR